MVLPRVPKVELEIVKDRTVQTDERGFLQIRRVDLVATHEDATKSGAFPYDVLERRALDAAVMVAHFEEAGHVHVYLRSAVRPPVALRPHAPFATGDMWEVPAGLVEPADRRAPGREGRKQVRNQRRPEPQRSRRAARLVARGDPGPGHPEPVRGK